MILLAKIGRVINPSEFHHICAIVCKDDGLMVTFGIFKSLENAKRWADNVIPVLEAYGDDLTDEVLNDVIDIGFPDDRGLVQ